MALFESVSNEPTPWILPEQREDAHFDGVATILHLRPMGLRAWNRYATRRSEDESKRNVPSDVRSDKVSDTDIEALRGAIAKVENAFKDGDVLETPEEIGRFVDLLDWVRAQQILYAVRSASALKEGEKKS